ncbi:MAG: AAA family ATPase [Actinomycetota bacterium]|nr:AAA family ATPase [Actinomycetota bacterium]
MICPSCGHENPEGNKFCGECAAPLVPTPSSQAEERKVVTVLFCDLVGFTASSDNADPEDVRARIRPYHSRLRTEIEGYGGTVEKFIGDAVMAVWGTPVAQEDDAERAVRTALDLMDAVAAMGEEIGAPALRARAGVLTGEAAVNLAAQGEGMVAGDLVNTASRIQSAAPAGQVFVGDATRRATEAAVVYEDAGLHELKGKAEPLRLHRALRVVAGVGGALKSMGLEPPFVGRERELRLVKELFHASAEDRKAHLLSVVGIGGIGKSRLSWEFYKYIDGLSDTMFWHRGRCLAYGEGVTYWALAEMVRMRARIVEAEEPSSAAEKLRACVEASVPDPEERRWIEPRLASLLGLEERAAHDREDLFGAWRLFFERLAEQLPVIMVFEDMQWADTSLLDFIEHLLDWSRSHPVFVMTLARPELAERHPHWAAGQRNFTSQYLEPLSTKAMEQLLTGLVPGLPEELRSQILARAEGIPLYAVETVRMLLDRGLLVREGNEYRTAGQVDKLEVPETLHALIAARLDGLSPDERRLVQDAAVLGKTSTKPALSALSGFPEEELDPILSSLVRKEILNVQADPRSPEHGQYGFLQDLVRTVAHDGLSRHDRRLRHLAAAEYLEQAWGSEEEEIVEVVASHYLEAHRADPSDVDAGHKARGMLVRAAERAASLGAGGEARRYYEQAIELAEDPLMEADLHERAGEAAALTADAAGARQHFERAETLFEELGRTRSAGRVQAALADLSFEAGDVVDAARRMERAHQALSSEEPGEELATVAAQLGRFLYFSGREDEALAPIEEALELAESLALREVFSHALNTRALMLQPKGRNEEAGVLLQHALQVALDADVPSAAFRSYNNLVALLARQDRHEEELETSRRGLELARRVGNRRWEWKFRSDMVNPLVHLGRWDEAVAIRDALGAEGALGVIAVAVEMAPIIPALLARGDLDEARAIVRSLEERADTREVQFHDTLAAARAMVARADGRPEEAIAIAEEILGDGQRSPADLAMRDIAVEGILAGLDLGEVERARGLLGLVERMPPGLFVPILQAQLPRLQARVAIAEGATAEPDFTPAEKAFRDFTMPFELAVTLLEHAEWLASAGRSQESSPLLEEAGEIFDRLQATPWLDRVEQARGRLSAGAS